jgi:TRAP-type C4-dicarboxylate transport system substrate-binding protein
MGERAWQRLPEDIQTIIAEEAEKAQQRYVEWVDRSEAASAESVKEDGASIYTYSEQQLQQWDDAAPDMLAQWVEELEGKGKGEAAQATADAWRKITAD